MKIHVVIMQESLFGMLSGNVYEIEEWNFTPKDENETPYFFGVDKHHTKLMKNEFIDELAKDGYIKRSWENLGQASLTEIVLAKTGVIAIFFFDTVGIPKGQLEYTLTIDEK